MTDEQDKSKTFQESFLFPHLAKFAGFANWPSQVPALAQFNEIVPELCKLPYDRLYRDDAKSMAECALLVWEYLDVDNAFAIIDSYNIEIEAMGGSVKFYEDHIPDIDRNDYFVKDESDLNKIEFKGLDSGRYPYLVEYYKMLTKYAGVDLFPELCAPWSMACNLYGMENLIIDTITDKEFVHDLMERIVDKVIIPTLYELRQEFPDAAQLIFADAWCAPPMVTVPIMKEFVAPYIMKIRDYCTEELGLGFGWGTGWVTGLSNEDRDYVLDLVTGSMSNIYAFAPDVDLQTPQFFRDYATKRGFPVVLGLSPAFIQSATTEEVRDTVKEYALVGKDGPTPLIIMCGCIGPFTPIENVRTFVEAVKTYGAVDATEDTPFNEIGEIQSFEDFLKEKIADNKAGYEFAWLKDSGYAHLA